MTLTSAGWWIKPSLCECELLTVTFSFFFTSVPIVLISFRILGYLTVNQLEMFCGHKDRKNNFEMRRRHCLNNGQWWIKYKDRTWLCIRVKQNGSSKIECEEVPTIDHYSILIWHLTVLAVCVDCPFSLQIHRKLLSYMVVLNLNESLTIIMIPNLCKVIADWGPHSHIFLIYQEKQIVWWPCTDCSKVLISVLCQPISTFNLIL